MTDPKFLLVVIIIYLWIMFIYSGVFKHISNDNIKIQKRKRFDELLKMGFSASTAIRKIELEGNYE